jgi:hypothetical protein
VIAGGVTTALSLDTVNTGGAEGFLPGSNGSMSLLMRVDEVIE